MGASRFSFRNTNNTHIEMKKEYKQPTIDVVKLQNTKMLMASVTAVGVFVTMDDYTFEEETI